uniref:Reverse transcriptase domain-containing protein n=1 Tax=Haemonchus contortus TaxID=6289 RepID=A0A7I4YW06_HAECO
MLNDLHTADIKAGLKINMKKTKCMRNEYSDRNPVYLQGEPLEDVDEYVYHGRLFNMKNDLKSELMRRKKAGWAAYNSISNVIEHTRDDELRATLFNSTVLPALSCASETWSLTKNLENQLRRMQMSLERRMVGITLHQQRLNRLHNENIRSLSNVRDIILHIDKAKHTFAGHLIRRDDGRWSTTSVCWEPREKKRFVVNLLYDGKTLLLTETISAIPIQLRQADALSRLIATHSPQGEDVIMARIARDMNDIFHKNVNRLPVTAKNVARTTAEETLYDKYTFKSPTTIGQRNHNRQSLVTLIGEMICRLNKDVYSSEAASSFPDPFSHRP